MSSAFSAREEREGTGTRIGSIGVVGEGGGGGRSSRTRSRSRRERSGEVCTSPPTPPAEIKVHATRAEFWRRRKSLG